MTVPNLPLWPARMPAVVAAAYCGVLDREGAPDPKRFERHVKKGLYPRPYRRPGEEKAWLKTELDQTLERLSASSSPMEADLD